jgi:hypothetical protein
LHHPFHVFRDLDPVLFEDFEIPYYIDGRIGRYQRYLIQFFDLQFPVLYLHHIFLTVLAGRINENTNYAFKLAR